MNQPAIPPLLRNHFEQTPDVPGGKLRALGTRVSVEQILELLEAGVTPAEIVQSLPSLNEQDVAAVERLAVHYPRTGRVCLDSLVRVPYGKAKATTASPNTDPSLPCPPAATTTYCRLLV